ncbi:MAG: hypothetical protein ACREVQ_01485 [Burkholderiales bacterium]
MPKRSIYLLVVPALLGMTVGASVHAKPPAQCSAIGLNGKASTPMQQVATPAAESCKTRMSHGFPIPDPACTPGAVNPSLTLTVLENPKFRTICVRDVATSASAKAKTYLWYNYRHPAHNTGASQTCELDHLVSLEIGGADTLDNIWPQCGPKGVVLRKRYFKEKDIVENYLAAQIRKGTMNLADVQRGIARDWTQYLDVAQKACPSGKCT